MIYSTRLDADSAVLMRSVNPGGPLLAKQSSDPIRVMPKEEVFRIASTLPYRTSCHLNWCGVEVHRYRITASEIPQHAYPQLAIFIPQTERPVKGEFWIAGNRMTAQLETGCVSIVPPNLTVRSRWEEAPREVTAIFIDPFLVAEVAQAEEADFDLEIRPQLAIRDPVIWEIGTALDNELVSVPPAPPIYAESLAKALAAHVLAKYTNPMLTGVRRAAAHKSQIRRSIEFIHENLHRNITLADIAAVANMSKYHFAKSFRQAMGIAPHQYLVELRIAKARKLLAVDCMSIEEIANRVGYSDKSHFAAQFLKVVGVTPHRYRREA